MSEFVQNTWYVAAWAHEVSREPLGRVILDEPIVLYRTEAGSPVALRNQCPHRKLPLSYGRLVGDTVECGYHGMTFDPQGRCVRVPGQSRIPSAAKVRRYPVREEMGMTWIWMGDPARVDQAARFKLEGFDESARTTSMGKRRLVECHYQLLTDNLTDPAHVSFVHRSTLGSPGQEEIPVEVEERGDTVVVSRWTLDRPPAPIFETLAGMTGRVDRWQYYYLYCPSICVVDFGSCEVGAISPGDARDGTNVVQIYSCIFLTPETARSTHYFYLQTRNFAPGDENVSTKILEQLEIAFEEDFVILEAQQRSMERFAATDDVKLALDSAPTRQRRVVQRMLAADRAGASVS